VNPQTGEGGPAEVKFFPEGKFLNTQLPGGKPIKSDGLPAYRRISAMLTIEETFEEKYPFPNPLALVDEKTRGEIWPLWKRQRELHASQENEVWTDHDVLVLHNPYAYRSLSQEVFAEFPQLVPVGNVMEWTDGEEVII